MQEAPAQDNLATLTSLTDDFVHLARLATTGREDDVNVFVLRMVRRYRSRAPELAGKLQELLRAAPTRATPLRDVAAAPIPVDRDTRLQLLRQERVAVLPVEPILPADVRDNLERLVAERRDPGLLARNGLRPTRSLLLTGAPGVGKSLVARWLARELRVPLLTLDLSAVMSSFLGRTGTNLRYVLDYAESASCVLLLDEFDAIAKRRDDATEIGELKRLVTVLLQEIDEWPASGLLVAATNHPVLLDPAVWRRFEALVELRLPDETAAIQAIQTFLDEGTVLPETVARALAFVLKGESFSDIERVVNNVRRDALLAGRPVEAQVMRYIELRLDRLSRRQRVEVAVGLVRDAGLSQRSASEFASVARDTIRDHLRRDGE